MRTMIYYDPKYNAVCLVKENKEDFLSLLFMIYRIEYYHGILEIYNHPKKLGFEFIGYL